MWDFANLDPEEIKYKMSMIVLGGEILEWVLGVGSRGMSVELGSPKWLSSVT